MARLEGEVGITSLLTCRKKSGKMKKIFKYRRFLLARRGCLRRLSSLAVPTTIISCYLLYHISRLFGSAHLMLSNGDTLMKEGGMQGAYVVKGGSAVTMPTASMVQQLTSSETALSQQQDQMRSRVESLRVEAARLDASVAATRILLLKLEEERQRLSSQLDRGLRTAMQRQETWLTIGIPTFARPNNLNYLDQTLHSIAQELPLQTFDPFYGKVCIVIMNTYGAGHDAFEAAKQRYAAPHPHSSAIVFADQDASSNSTDPLGAEARDEGDANTPGYRVRKQTRDLAALLRISQELAHSQYFFVLEDDMLVCPHALWALEYILSKTELYHPDFLSLRASYGMNGLLLHDKDVLPFAKYLLEHQLRRPPDHLAVEWFAGETLQSAQYKSTRAHVSFRYNLFNHIGTTSSLRPMKQKRYPVCFEPLLEPILFQVEAFRPNECPEDDIWPCQTVPATAKQKMPAIGWGVLRSSLDA